MITLTLTPEYARDITDERLDENIGTDYQSFERQADDSIVLKMTTEQYADYIDYIRSRIISVAQNMVANDRNNITDISFNDNFSEATRQNCSNSRTRAFGRWNRTPLTTALSGQCSRSRQS